MKEFRQNLNIRMMFQQKETKKISLLSKFINYILINNLQYFSMTHHLSIYYLEFKHLEREIIAIQQFQFLFIITP